MPQGNPVLFTMSPWNIVLAGSGSGEEEEGCAVGKITNYCNELDQPLHVEEDTYRTEFTFD